MRARCTWNPWLSSIWPQSVQYYFSVINWNFFCLADFRYSPDVVFLQEVIPPYLLLLQMKAGNYTIIPGKKKTSGAKDKSQKIKFGFILSLLPRPPTILKNMKSKVKKEALDVSVFWYRHISWCMWNACFSGVFLCIFFLHFERLVARVVKKYHR